MQPMNRIPRFTRRTALVAALVFFTALARAQQADAPSSAPDKNPDGTDKVVALETFTVTGIRRGIEESIANKREAVSVVESVSSEDIGKLPDISIA